MDDYSKFIESNDIIKLLMEIDEFTQESGKVESRYNILELDYLDKRLDVLKRNIDFLIQYETFMISKEGDTDGKR